MVLDFLLFAFCQGPSVPVALASATGDTRLPQDPIVWDEDWIWRQEGPPGAQLYLGQQGEMALCGDLDGDGVFEAPLGIDALAWCPGPSPGAGPYDVLFSTSSSSTAYADGDLLRFLPGQGIRVEVSEAEFLAALRPASGDLDVDAAEWEAPDRIYFSVASALEGTVLGRVDAGDVLVLERSTGRAWRACTEAQLQRAVERALGRSVSIGDVLSIAFYPPTGELAFTVQSPEWADATVFGVGHGGRVLPRWTEADWRFQQETELDALTFPPAFLAPPPILAVDVPFLPQSVPVRFTIHHGAPWTEVRGYLAGAPGFVPRPGEGIGFFFLDPGDPWLRREVASGRVPWRTADGSGSATFSWTTPALPPKMAFLDLYFQARGAGGAGWSPPIVVRVQ